MQKISVMAYIISSVLILVNLFSCQPEQKKGDDWNEAVFTMNALSKDFDETINAIQDHPKLYRFTQRSEFEELIREQRDLITRDLSAEEFYCILKPVITQIGCCHSTIWMPEGFWESYDGLLFPFQIMVLQSGVFVSKSYAGDASIPAGAEILSINDISVDEILTGLKTLISADAFNEGHIRYRLKMRFPFLFALKYGPSEQFLVEYIEPPAQEGIDERDADSIDMAVIATKSVNAIGPGPIRAELYPDEDLVFSLSMDSSIAVMTIKTFAYYDETKKFQSYLDNSFQEIKRLGISRLIIDLRGNDGGDPFCSVPLLSYIAPRPIPYFARPFGRYASFADPVKLNENKYTGHLLTITDGGNVSTSGHFCALLKYHGIGKLVGSETGATFTCNDASKTTVLKYTGLEVNVPRRTFATAVYNLPDDQGILPDFPVETSVLDLVNGEDGIINYTMELFSLLEQDTIIIRDNRQ